MTQTLAPTATLSAADRCDGCGAQAYVRVTLVAGGELLFCGHHWNRHSEALKPQVADLVDETTRLVESPSTAD